MTRMPTWLAALALSAAAFVPGASAQTIITGPTVNPANGHTYYRVNGLATWAGYRNYARTLGGHLAVINNEDENTWVRTGILGASTAYLGFTDEAVEGAFVWENGQPVDYTNWAPGEPNNSGNEDFGAMNAGGQWNDIPNLAVHAIIEVSGNDVCQFATPVTIGGPTAVVNLGRATEDSYESSKICEHWTGPAIWLTFTGDDTLVTVTTCTPERNFDTVIQVFRGSCANLSCVGANDEGCEGGGSALTFYAHQGETYFVLLRDYFVGRGSVYVTGVRVEHYPVPPAEILDGPVHRPGSDSTYYSTFHTSWPLARAKALSMGGDLVTINDEQENDFVRLNVSFPDYFFFCGLNDRAVEGTFAWASGQPLTYTNWNFFEPTGGQHNDYVLIESSGQWYDTDLGTIMPAVIEVTRDACYGATEVTVPGTAFAQYTPGPLSLGEIPCNGSAGQTPVGRGLWYSIVGNNQNVTVSTCDTATNMDTSLRVFTGDCALLNCVDGNEDDGVCSASGFSPPSWRSTTTFFAEQGRLYRILVGKFNNADPAPGDQFRLNVTTAPAAQVVFSAQSAVNPATCTRYMAMTPSLPFLQAADAADALWMSLASIASAQENTLVRSFATGAGLGNVWIGFTDLQSPSLFTWLDGSPLTYLNWNPGEPSNGGFGEFYTECTTSGGWNDLPDYSERAAVAEYPVGAVPGGKIRGAMMLQGLGEYVSLPDNAVPWTSGQYTVELWARTTTRGVILGQYGTSPAGGYVPMLYVGTDGRIRAADWVGTNPSSTLTGPVVTDGQWFHVALVRSGLNRSLIVNGDVVATSAFGPVNYSGSYAYRLGNGDWAGWGGASASPTGPFIGEIDEVRVWSVGRTLAEIRSTKDTRYFNPGNYPGLRHQYTLDDAGSRLAFDAKSLGHARFWNGVPSPRWVYEDRDGSGASDVCAVVCEADIDGNGVVNSTDVSEFINTWFADQTNGTLNADFNRNGVSNSTDVSDMINAYFASLPPCV